MAQIMNHALRYNNKELGTGYGWLFTSLLLHADNSLLCWPSDATLESEGNGSQPTVQKRREWLIERGAIIPVPFEKRPDNVKHLWHKKIVYQITGVMFIKNNPKDDDSTYKIIPTVFMTNDEQVESLTEQLRYLGFFERYNLTEEVYPKVFLPKVLLGKEPLAKETLYEVSTVSLSMSKASSETKVSDSVQPEAENPDGSKADREDGKAHLASLAELGVPLHDGKGNPVETPSAQSPQKKKDFSTAPPPEPTVVSTTPLTENEWLELWVKAILWTTDSVKLWKGFNKSKKHHGFGQQVGDAGTLRTAWEGLLELHPDNEALRQLMPHDIMKDYYGFKETRFPQGKAEKNGWLFSAKGKSMKTDLTMGSAMLVRWFNEYLTHSASLPYKKTKGLEDEKELKELASQAKPKQGLYDTADDDKKAEIRKKMFANKNT